jgi:hypothetical protein
MGIDNIYTFWAVFSCVHTSSLKYIGGPFLAKDPCFLLLRINLFNLYYQLFASRIRREHNQLNNQMWREPGGIVVNWRISCSSYLKGNQIGP